MDDAAERFMQADWGNGGYGCCGCCGEDGEEGPYVPVKDELVLRKLEYATADSKGCECGFVLRTKPASLRDVGHPQWI